MNLHSKLLEREAAGKPVTVGVIGAGKFGTMFLSQARLTRGMHVVGRRRSRRRARPQPARRPPAGRTAAYAAASLDDAHKTRATFVTDDAEALIADPRIEVIVEATGVPGAGIQHALQAIAQRQAHRHGQRRGRRAGGPAAGAQGEGRGRGLFAWPGATSRR